MRVVISALGALLLSACSSQPRQVQASLPLVSEQLAPIGTPISSQYWSSLNIEYATSISHPQYTILAQPSYTSALGITCRTLSITPLAELNSISTTPITRTACQQTTQDENGKSTTGWFLVQDIVENSSAVEI
ncbi:hypothetical protein [Vibrio sp. WXL210]|uniref:hypothetical protein n=1 Tax=Vibrio sp. WXL210 TaxID=3450709 RepID=UPI003EC55158